MVAGNDRSNADCFSLVPGYYSRRVARVSRLSRAANSLAGNIPRLSLAGFEDTENAEIVGQECLISTFR